jgi:hypothetical protein
VKDTGVREKVGRQLLDPFPREAIRLAAAPKHVSPETGGGESEGPECARVRWHYVIGKEAGDDLPQSPPLLGNRLMHASPQLPFNLLQLRLHAIALALPLEEEVSSARLAALKGEA